MLAVLAAGCMEAPAAPTFVGYRDVADERADDWSRDARLAKAACVEGPFHPWMAEVVELRRGVAADQATPLHLPGRSHLWPEDAIDTDVGDGRCVTWAFQYVGPQAHTWRAVVVSDGGATVRSWDV